MKNRLKTASMLCALLFLVVSAPAASAADDDYGNCYACEMCYSPTWFCTSCGVMALSAISGCCGMGNGTTYCVPDYGGFATNCSNGRACQCDMNGNNCDPLLIGG